MDDVYGMNRILDIAKEYSLPDWWVLSVFIEYFDCRRYAENGRVWTFDFDKPGQQDIKTIPEKMITVPGYIILQNVRPADSNARAPLLSMGLPAVTFEDADLVPEGPFNSSGFPGIGNSCYVYDNKLELGLKAIVRDANVFYQWDIAKMEKYCRDKGDPIDDSEFSKIGQKLQEYRNSPKIKQPDQRFKTGVEEAYKELEKAREKIRQKILSYHRIKKECYGALEVNVQTPPMLSYFDGNEYKGGTYHVKTHMEPLFFRSAIRSLNKATKAKENRDSNQKDYDSLLDEIEYSAACIVSVVSCLESYINYVIDKHLSVEPKDNSIRGKWRCVPKLLESPFEFDEDKPPYSDFSCIVDCRNNAVHHESTYVEAERGISVTYSQLNVENAKTAVRVVRDMVTTLSKKGKIQLPTWIKTHDVSAAYWNEVSDYLKKM